jgi:hypothetical protein
MALMDSKIYHHWQFPPAVMGLYILLLCVVTIAVITLGGSAVWSRDVTSVVPARPFEAGSQAEPATAQATTIKPKPMPRLVGWPVSKGCTPPYAPVWVDFMLKRQG